MFIESSSISLQSNHQKTSVEQESVSLRAWIDGVTERPEETRSVAGRQSFDEIVDEVKLSAQSLALAHGKMDKAKLPADATHDHLASVEGLRHCAKGHCRHSRTAPQDEEVNDTVIGDSRLNLMKQLVEVLSGRKISLFNAPDSERHTHHEALNEQPANQDAPSGNPVSQTSPDLEQITPRREGWGVSYDYHKITIQQEQTNFAARGSVQTGDGRQIDFASALQMERENVTHTSVQLRAGDAKLIDPLVLNFGVNAVRLTEEKIDFDLNSDGRDESISFVTRGSGILVNDRNGDGIVNDGRELFGPATGNGFVELAALDGDGNGWIDEGDESFNSLRIWQGTGESRGLTDLRQNNVGAIYLGWASTPFENRTAGGTLLGQTTATGVYLTQDGQSGTIQQIDLVS